MLNFILTTQYSHLLSSLDNQQAATLILIFSKMILGVSFFHFSGFTEASLQ